jgi:hypothetical protein
LVLLTLGTVTLDTATLGSFRRGRSIFSIYARPGYIAFGSSEKERW